MYDDKPYIPHEMECYFDLDEAIAVAKKQNKPLFIDVTGHACNNCREMETRVWNDNRVLNLLENKYIICALYVDDKMKLDPADYYTSAEGKVMTELGRKNCAIAKERWNVTSQPGYVLVTPDGEAMLMPEPLGFETDINKFVKYLETGIKNFQSGTTYAVERTGKVKDTVDENFQSGTTYAAERPGKVWGTVEEFNDDAQAQWELTALWVKDDIYELRFTATINPGFHGYPLTDVISGPIFTWEDDSILVGAMTEPLASTLHNGEYEGKVEYAQRVKGNNGDVVKVNVLSTFFKGNMCTSSDCDFTVTLN